MSGISGHMMHPIDNLDLTGKELVDLLQKSINGELPMTEKIDGFGLHLMKVSNTNSINAWRIVRSRKDLKEGGVKFEDISTRFAHNPIAQKFYKNSIRIMSEIPEELFKKFEKFSENNFTYNCECLEKNGVTNVIHYEGNSPLYIHNIWKWDVNEVDVVELGFEIDEKEVKTDPKLTYKKEYDDEDCYKYSGSDLKLADHFKNQLKQYIYKYAGLKLYIEDIPDELINKIFNRVFRYGDQTNLKEIKKELKEYVEDTKQFFEDMEKIRKMIISEWDSIILNAGQIILHNVHGYINEGKVPFKEMNEVFDIENDLHNENKVIQNETRRCLRTSHNTINPIEGVVVEYKGNKYKFTGTFAPYNRYVNEKRF